MYRGTPVWRKSSRSDGADNCVEVALNVRGVVPLRDSKDPDGAILEFSRDGWRAFISDVRSGQLG